MHTNGHYTVETIDESFIVQTQSLPLRRLQ